VDIAANTLHAVDQVHESVEPLLLERFPFLGETLPPPRFKMMIAASAEMHFRTQIEGRPLRERVGRHLELRLIHRLLRGDHLPQLTRTKVIEHAIGEITQPTAETILRQSVDEGEPETVLPERQRRAVSEESEPFTVLGYQSGLIKDASKIEMRIFPDFSLLLSVPPSVPGQQSSGVEFLETEHDFLRKPMAITVKRITFDFEREFFVLLNVKPIEVGALCMINAIPSSIIDRGFLTDQALTFHRPTEDTIDSELGTITGLSGRTKALAAAWIKEFAQLCYEHELKQAEDKPPKMLVPSRAKAASALARVAVSLLKLGGASLVSDLVNEINRRYNTVVRVNNTRREVYRQPELLEFDPADDQIMKLTAKGKAYATAYLRSGGDSGKAPEME
jgi:hypothetical protein